MADPREVIRSQLELCLQRFEEGPPDYLFDFNLPELWEMLTRFYGDDPRLKVGPKSDDAFWGTNG